MFLTKKNSCAWSFALFSLQNNSFWVENVRRSYMLHTWSTGLGWKDYLNKIFIFWNPLIRSFTSLNLFQNVTALLICMFLRDWPIKLRFKSASYFFTQTVLFYFPLFHIFHLNIKIILTVLNAGARSQPGRSFCSFFPYLALVILVFHFLFVISLTN